jgi:hypothetical protein
MSTRTIALILLVVACLLALVLPVPAQTDDQTATVIYSNTFSSDPHWTTNSPSSDYWDPSLGMYHFSLEPSTGNYAYTKIDPFDGPFTFEFDVLLQRVDPGATFRFGLTGAEMDPNKGPNVLSEFTNAKFGQIMWLHLVTPGNKQMEVNSQAGDSLTSGPTAYSGPTAKYELNKTYHVTMNYDDDRKILSIRYTEKITGRDVWGYYLNTAENLHGLNRIYIGSRGDYGPMYIYAEGYIDNVRLTVPGAAVTPQPTFATATQTPATGVTTKKPTTKPTTVPAPVESATPASPVPVSLVISALGLTGLAWGIRGIRKN